MEFVNEFRVPVSIDQAWEVLTDVERVVSALRSDRDHTLAANKEHAVPAQCCSTAQRSAPA